MMSTAVACCELLSNSYLRQMIDSSWEAEPLLEFLDDGNHRVPFIGVTRMDLISNRIAPMFLSGRYCASTVSRFCHICQT